MRVWCIKMLPLASDYRAHIVPSHLRSANFLNLSIEEHEINGCLPCGYMGVKV